jgi:hypothetical protein
MDLHSGVKTASYTGGGVSVVSALTLTEIGIIVGIATAILTLVINALYTYRKDRREKLETEARLKKLRGRDE